jgi:hypothetical protein
VLKKIFGPTRQQETRNWINYIKRSFWFVLLTKYYSDKQINKNGWGMWHVWEREEIHTGFWWGNLKESDHLENLGVMGK